jgi:uncharacterized repeat protein (TIGR02543 family)
LTGTPVTVIPVNTIGNQEFWAKWTLNSYTIIYNVNGGTGVTNSTYTVESAVITLPTPTKTGYTFAGWYSNAGLTGTPVTVIPVNTTGDKEFWAKWTVVVSDARLLDIQLSTGELTSAFSGDLLEYTLVLPCGETAVTIAAIPSTGSTVRYISNSSTVYFDYPGTKTLIVRSTAADGVTMDYTITVIRRYPSDLIRKYWDNVVAVNLKPESNGGYTFTAYQWTLNGEVLPGETGEYLHLPNGSASGEYGVILTANGQTAAVCEGIQMSIVSRGLKVYPNPASVNVTVENPLWKDVPRMQLYDMAGHLIKEYPVGSSHTTINVTGIPTGVYMLKAGNETVKLIKN